MHEPDLAPNSRYREQEYGVGEDDAHPLAPATGHDEVPLAANYKTGTTTIASPPTPSTTMTDGAMTPELLPGRHSAQSLAEDDV